jgi:tetratricopeptide (TPR) repeat protein
MSSVAGQSVAIGNLGKVGGNQVYAQMNQDKMQMFVERYLELSNELKYRKGESHAYMQLGEILTQKGDYDSSTKHFYRAMKISEDVKDENMKEKAKVNFGMANASLKWNNHITGLLEQIEKTTQFENNLDDVEDERVEEASPEDEYDKN